MLCDQTIRMEFYLNLFHPNGKFILPSWSMVAWDRGKTLGFHLVENNKIWFIFKNRKISKFQMEMTSHVFQTLKSYYTVSDIHPWTFVLHYHEWKSSSLQDTPPQRANTRWEGSLIQAHKVTKIIIVSDLLDTLKEYTEKRKESISIKMD